MAKKRIRPNKSLVWTGDPAEEHQFYEKDAGIEAEVRAEERTESVAEPAEGEPVNLEQILEQIEPEPAKEKRKRGARKTAATDKTSGKKGAPEDNLKLADAIFAIHAGIAYLTKIDEIALSVENAEKLGAAIETVDKNLKRRINPKFIAWANLITTAIGIYVPIGWALKNKIKENKEKKTAKNTINTNLNENKKVFPIVDLNG